MHILNWLRCPSVPMLLIAAVLLGLAPFSPEPHLLQKARMLLQGETLRAADIFDIFWHSWPLIWLALRLFVPTSAACKVKP
ncbi:MAG: hypothetical protein Q9M30_04235 [Mariprofundaceae bacterium]|nr:hypothetical protein [Mariprofundaceae bacterium]